MPTGGGAPLRFADRAYGIDSAARQASGCQDDASFRIDRSGGDHLVPGARCVAVCRIDPRFAVAVDW